MNLSKPARLVPGATIAVVAPASPIRDRVKLEQGIRYLESRGFRIVRGRSLDAADGYLAGSDSLRADELNGYFADSSIDAIFCARGGYGTMRLLPLLDWETIRRNPKIFVGFSDITALQWALLAKAGLPSISGLMVGVDFDNPDPTREALFWSLLTTPQSEYILWEGTKEDCLCAGATDGILLAGTLALAAALCGTPYYPPFDGSILVLEDVGEETYRIDRMLCQLAHSGALSRCRGLAFGTFSPPSSQVTTTPERPLRTILSEYTPNIPAVMNLPYGHIRGKISVPIGLQARLDADRQQLLLLESLVA